MTQVRFTEEGWDSYTSWTTVDKKMLPRINKLIDAALRDPYTGVGRPEPLKYALAGAWSRRISIEHRLVYLPPGGDNPDLVILSAKYHY
jgi:toxin YoeB